MLFIGFVVVRLLWVIFIVGMLCKGALGGPYRYCYILGGC